MGKPTTAKHTPGPWTLEDHTEVVARVPSPNGPRSDVLTICRAADVDIYVDGRAGTPEANARLISAAPDLLAACEAVDEYMVLSGHPDHDPEECECGAGYGYCAGCTLVKARAAIAKAKGETGGGE